MMSLKIRNQGTRNLTEEFARQADEPATQAGPERPGRIRKRRNRAALAKRLLEIGRQCAALPVLDKRRPEVMLYDRRGLPK
jgi:antitoxin VapB